MAQEREPVRWITVKGKHFPVYEDGSVGWQSGKEEPKKQLGSSLKFTKLPKDEDDIYNVQRWEAEGGFSISRREARNGTVTFYILKDGNVVDTVKKYPGYNTGEEKYFDEAISKAQSLYDAETRQDKAVQNPDSKKDLQSRLMEAEFGDTFGKPKSVPLSKRASILQELSDNQSINPNYTDKDASKKGYRTNCSLCTISTIMQMKGYDVEAGVQPKYYNKNATDKDHIDCSNVFKPNLANAGNFIMSSAKIPYTLSDRNIKNRVRESLKLQGITDEDKIQSTISQVQSNINRMPKGAKQGAKFINDVVSKWDNSAYGEMSVWWKNGNGHSLFIYNDNGTPVVYDMQSGTKSVGVTGIEDILKEAHSNNTEIIRYDDFVGFNGNIRDRLSGSIKKKGGK